MSDGALCLCALLTLVIAGYGVPILISRFVCRKVGHAWVNVGSTGEYRCKRCDHRFDRT